MQKLARLRNLLTASSLLIASMVFAMAGTPPRTAYAAALAQSSSANGSGSVSASLPVNATAGNLLVVVCAALDSSSFSPPSGFATAITSSTDPSQAIFYKIASGGESSYTCSASGNDSVAIQLYEYSGIHGYTTVDTTASATGSGTSISTGTVNTTHANDLLLAAAAGNGKSYGIPDQNSSWANGFTQRETGVTGSGNPSSRIAYGGADQVVATTGNYSATVSMDQSGVWQGQIVAFRAMAASPTLTGDIVDASGNSVMSPSVNMSALSSDFSCQNSSGTLGTSSERIRVANSTDSPSWSLTIAATGGPASNWTSGSNSYSFNDPAGSGCTNGQLTVQTNNANVAPASGCSNAGVSLGSDATFSNGTTDSITLASASTPAAIDCYWDFTGFNLKQKVPAEQASGNYNLSLTITVSAS